MNKPDQTDPVIRIVHREGDPDEDLTLFMVEDPGEEDPVEDTYEIKD